MAEPVRWIAYNLVMRSTYSITSGQYFVGDTIGSPLRSAVRVSTGGGTLQIIAV